MSERHDEGQPPPGPVPARKPRPERLTPEPRHVAYPLTVAAGWSWRFLLVAAAVAVLVVALRTVSMVVVPLAVAMLMTALLAPVARFLREKWHFRGALATFCTVFGFIALVAGLLTFAGTQIVSGMSGMLEQAKAGLAKIVDWLHTGPLQLSQEQVQDYIDKAKAAFSGDGASSWVSRGTEWAGSAGHFLAGILIALFATFFFLSQGKQIWGFLVSLMPTAAQEPTFQAGRRGWVSLSSYIRVQVLVAAVDAVGIGIGAAILRLPFVIALALLVFLTSFIPIVGAIASGAVAVLVALVTHGPVSALVMLGVVLLVQQLESHVLQPFLMGRAVALHPLAVLLAVVIGSSLLGIVGALFAVPLLAVANTVIRYYHGYDPFPELGSEPMPESARARRLRVPADPDDAVEE
ncbi:AI-2E family transporter [Nakamurella lactea]|uniref:AI-2E family transporter n=1 Tax=Nakamurella lactea TaxID=459515 RepID=UPI000411860E|nr:AI-2E family transporter [Nakamurella lactea]